MIQSISLYQPNCLSYKPSFKQNFIKTLTHTNIGSCSEGVIGKVRVRREDGGEAFLDVFKKFKNAGPFENYTLQDESGNLIGNMNIEICKLPVPPWMKTDPSYVFVNKLTNFSNPNTPCYIKGLSYYKDIGTRLLQIAQRRSDESMCFGNIKLVAKHEAMDWYLNIIRMRREFPPQPGKILLHNPDQLYLPPESKEPLSKLRGGL